MIPNFNVYNLDEAPPVKDENVVEVPKIEIEVIKSNCCPNPVILVDVCGCEICDTCSDYYQCEECYAHEYSVAF